MSEHMTAELMDRMHLSVDDYMTTELRAAIAKAVRCIDALREDDTDSVAFIHRLDEITDHDLALLRDAGKAMRTLR